MSATVNFVAIRKTDAIPYFTAYLGGNGTRDHLFAFHKSIVVETEDGYVIPLLGLNSALFLIEMSDEMYGDNFLDDCLEFLKRDDADNYWYFITIET